MKMFVKTGIAVAAFFATTMLQAVPGQAPSRSAVIQASGQLAAHADFVSQYAQQNGYANIANGTFDIARLGGDVEIAARMGTVQQAQAAVNDIITYYIKTMRPLFNNVPPVHQNLMRSTLRNAINDLLTELNLTHISYSCAPGADCEDLIQMQVTGGTWKEDGGAPMGEDHGTKLELPGSAQPGVEIPLGGQPGNGGWNS